MCFVAGWFKSAGTVSETVGQSWVWAGTFKVTFKAIVVKEWYAICCRTVRPMSIEQSQKKTIECSLAPPKQREVENARACRSPTRSQCLVVESSDGLRPAHATPQRVEVVVV